MPDEWVPPKPEVRLEGSVVFVCADCKERIDGDPVLWPLEDGQLMSITRAYHPDHLPRPHQEMTNGR